MGSNDMHNIVNYYKEREVELLSVLKVVENELFAKKMMGDLSDRTQEEESERER